ncbi:hypothetical protein V5P93_001924 [Actinokineospora auranticolor]|nr:hypothetical protein [Actinokineospora auranticolor]
MVGRHLVAAGMLIDEDPERALVHARYARERAARVPVVREAAGLTAYHAGEWAEALSELRAVRRMSGGNAHVAVMADCERALGRPERALELAKEAGRDLPPEVSVELRIVSAGARRDMGQLDAAVVGLQGPDLDPKRRDPWSARLFYAYADNLAAAGRAEEAITWFLNAAQADDDEDTDAAERAFELGADESEIAAALPGDTLEIEDDEDTDADEPTEDTAADETSEPELAGTTEEKTAGAAASESTQVTEAGEETAKSAATEGAQTAAGADQSAGEPTPTAVAREESAVAEGSQTTAESDRSAGGSTRVAEAGTAGSAATDKSPEDGGGSRG